MRGGFNMNDSEGKINFEEAYRLWDEFLEKWPISRLETMQLDEYTKTGSRDTFTYWLEHKLKFPRMGGFSAFKFGIFARNDITKKEPTRNRRYSETHGWHPSLGGSPQEVFGKVRDFVVDIATLSRDGNLDLIETIDSKNLLLKTYKWKIAFHYQDRDNPKIIGVLRESNLTKYIDGFDSQTMAKLHSAVMQRKPRDVKSYYQIWCMAG